MNHLAAPTPGEPPSVFYDPQTRSLLIEHLHVDDPLVLDEIRYWTTGHRGPAADDTDLATADLAPFLHRVLPAGVAAVRAAGGLQNAHHLDRLIAQVGDQATKASHDAAAATATAANTATAAITRATADTQRALLDAGKATRESISEHVDASKRSLLEEIQRLVGGDQPLLGIQLAALLTTFGAQLDDRVGKRTDELFTQAARTLDPRDPTSPLAELVKQIVEQQATLADRVDKGHLGMKEQLEKVMLAVTAAAAANASTRALAKVTPIKGTTYADGVHQHLQVLALQHGAEYQDTSSEVGSLTRCKKGDGVLIVATPTGTRTARVVVEMADSSNHGAWTDYLDEAERNRNAVASLGLVRTADQVPGGEPLRMFGPRKMVLAFDPVVDDPALLKVVVQLLSAQAVLVVARSGGENVRTAEEKITEALGLIAKLTDVQKTVGHIRKGADKIDVDLATLQIAVSRLLAEAIGALGGTDDGEAAAA